MQVADMGRLADLTAKAMRANAPEAIAHRVEAGIGERRRAGTINLAHLTNDARMIF
jgi:hypothetical protein